jgi:hypothetical protein
MRALQPASAHWLVAILCTLGCLSPARAFAWGRWPPEGPAIRGITVGPIESSQQPGRGYGTPYSAALLDELVRQGANSVSITPFGRIWSLQSTDILMDFETPYAENREAVRRMIVQAKDRGLTVLVIPHLWVETSGWRGEIEPGSPESWRKYQISYRNFVMNWARDAQAAGADAFSIGVECKSFSGRFGGFWTGLIRDVRGVFRGKLTYSANWDEAEDVLFWDQLDFIGINAFYPLADHDNASDAEYAAGAQRALGTVEGLHAALHMPVLFVEIGYTTRPNAAVQPWLWPDDMDGVVVDPGEQARALAALIGASVRNPWLSGFYVWRYYANLDDVSQEADWGFSPHAKPSEALLSEVFGTPWAADPQGPLWDPVLLAPRDPRVSLAPP